MRIYHRWPLRGLAEKLTERRFFSTHEWRGLHLGIFSSFGDARTFCSERGVFTRYDLDHDWWETIQREMKLHDYPMLYWLSRSLTPQSRVGDLGGSVGVSYYALRRLLPAGAPMEWRVCELPDVCEKGRLLARERGVPALHFTTSFSDLDAHDVWFSAGAIQFIEQPIHELLKALHHPPRHLLLNRVPTTSSLCRIRDLRSRLVTYST